MSPSPVVIMAHGAFCGGWVFEDFRKPFEAAGLRVLAPDLPGHGAGESPGGLSIRDYARFLADLCAAQDQPPLLIGHSMGGLAAQMAAEKAEVAGLILLAPSSPWGEPVQTMEEGVSALGLLAMGAYWLGSVHPDRGLTASYSLDRVPAADQARLCRAMTAESGRALFEVLNWWLDPAMTTQVGNLKGTASLTLVGDRDRINPAVTVERTARRLGGDYRRLEGMSHWLPGEPGWEDVAQACLDWVAQRGLGGRDPAGQ